MNKKEKALLFALIAMVVVSTFLTYKKYILDENIVYVEDEVLFQQSLTEEE